jgi:predicted DNA-binding ribbon-helix-helix protein
MRLEEEQIRELWQIAHRRGVPVSALIREAVRRFLSLDPWEEELSFMDRRVSGLPVGPSR